jgi:hypothetical protein
MVEKIEGITSSIIIVMKHTIKNCTDNFNGKTSDEIFAPRVILGIVTVTNEVSDKVNK